jgi:hypothetical protein
MSTTLATVTAALSINGLRIINLENRSTNTSIKLLDGLFGRYALGRCRPMGPSGGSAAGLFLEYVLSMYFLERSVGQKNMEPGMPISHSILILDHY